MTPARRASRVGLGVGICVVALTLAAFATWFGTRPGAAFAALREATRTHDLARVNEYVDFAALRESLKSRLRSQLANEMAQARARPFAAIGAMLGTLAVEPVVDRIVSPAGLALAMNGASVREQLTKMRGEASPSANVTYASSWDSLDRYRVTISSDGRTVVSLVLTRSGLATWRLSEIE